MSWAADTGSSGISCNSSTWDRSYWKSPSATSNCILGIVDVVARSVVGDHHEGVIHLKMMSGYVIPFGVYLNYLKSANPSRDDDVGKLLTSQGSLKIDWNQGGDHCCCASLTLQMLRPRNYWRSLTIAPVHYCDLKRSFFILDLCKKSYLTMKSVYF